MLLIISQNLILKMIENVILNIFIILIGYLIKKLKFFPPQTGSVLSKFVMYITLPATILRVFLSSVLNKELFVLPFASFFLGIFVFLIGFLFLKKINFDKRLKWTLLISICGYNVGLFSYPFIKVLYGDEGVLYMAMFDIGNSFIVFGLSYALALMSEDGAGFRSLPIIVKKVISFFPLDVYIISLFINILGMKIPYLIINLISQLSLPNSTLALFTIGYFLEFELSMEEVKALIYGLFLRFFPGIVLTLFLFLFLSDSLMIRIISIGSLLPAPLVVVIYSNEKGLNVKFASFYVSISVLIGIIFLVFLTLMKGG